MKNDHKEIQKKFERSSTYQSRHELEITKENNKLETKQIELDSGLLGKIFGGKENAPTNIAGFLIVVSFVAGGIASALNTDTYAKDFWIILSPFITLSLGYIFGKNT